MKATTLKVQGMTCDRCANAIDIALSQVVGVKCSEISLEHKNVLVHHDSSVVFDNLVQAIEDAGFDVVYE